MVTLGVVKGEDSTQQKTSQFHLWLLAYEFSETIVIVTPEKVVFLTSKRKKILLEEMEKPEGYEGPQVTVVLREASEGKTEQNFERGVRTRKD